MNNDLKQKIRELREAWEIYNKSEIKTVPLALFLDACYQHLPSILDALEQPHCDLIDGEPGHQKLLCDRLQEKLDAMEKEMVCEWKQFRDGDGEFYLGCEGKSYAKSHRWWLTYCPKCGGEIEEAQ